MRRLQATLLHDFVLQYRNGFYAAAGFVLLCWAALLSQARELALAPLLAPLVIGNLILTGFYFVAGLLLLERDEGTLLALAITPLRRGERLTAKAISLALLGLVENALIGLLMVGPSLAGLPFALGCLLAGAIYVLCGAIAVARYDSINAFLMPSVLYTALLSLPALAGMAGWQSPLLWLHPLWPPYLLLQAGTVPAPLGELLAAGLVSGLWIVGLGWWATRSR